MYDIAKPFYIEHGNLAAPKRFKTEEGYALGTWLMTRRRIKAGEQYGTFGADRIVKLDEIGMVWKENMTADICEVEINKDTRMSDRRSTAV